MKPEICEGYKDIDFAFEEAQKAIEKVNAQQEKFMAAFELFGEALVRLVDAVEDLKRWE